MGDIDHRAVARPEPAAYAHATAFVILGCNTLGFKPLHVFGGDGHREIGFPVNAEIEEAAPPDLADIEDAPLDQRKPVNLRCRSLGVENQVIGHGPDAGPAFPGFVFMRQHPCSQCPVVGEAVDPCQPVGEHARLNPGSVRGKQMGEKTVIAIDALATEGQGDPLTENQPFQRVPGFVGQRPFFETGAPQRQLGGLNSDKPHLTPVFEYDGVAIHHLDHPHRLADFQCVSQGFGDVGTGRAESGQNDKNNKRCAQDHHGRQYNLSRCRMVTEGHGKIMAARLTSRTRHVHMRPDLQGVLTLRTALFAEIAPRKHGRLSLDGGHDMYWEEAGCPDGVPIVFLHGGPGAGTMPVHRRFFDPEYFRIILFDQRGGGRSTPSASVEANTTAHLIGDLETLRAHLSVERWHLFGGSWGSTLALAYAQAYPGRCLGLVLRGIFTCSPREVDWFLYGMGRIFPDAWQDFASAIPEGERDDLLMAYYRRLTDPDPDIHMPVARSWATYEARCSTLKPNPDAVRAISASQGTLALARIEAHYLANGAFLEADELISRADRLRGIPGAIVHGRYDMVCPVETADRLARAWPEAEFTIVPDAGHSALEPGTRTALLNAVERLKGIA